jgi:hypothetical protein
MGRTVCLPCCGVVYGELGEEGDRTSRHVIGSNVCQLQASKRFAPSRGKSFRRPTNVPVLLSTHRRQHRLESFDALIAAWRSCLPSVMCDVISVGEEFMLRLIALGDRVYLQRLNRIRSDVISMTECMTVSNCKRSCLPSVFEQNSQSRTVRGVNHPRG